jgi:hypothetical protein
MATYTLISSNVLASSAASVTFSAIPATYTDLVVRLSARATTANYANGFIVQLNSVGTNQSATWLIGNGSAASSAAYAFVGGYTDAATATSNTFNSAEVYIPNYNSATYHPVSTFSATENNTTGSVLLTAQAGLWSSATAITSVKIQCDTDNFVSGSSFYLYGISSS